MGRAGGFGQLEAGDPRRVGPYRVLALLGAGGMGREYLAESRGGRLVAVKVIRPEVAGHDRFRRRFAREVAAAKAVSGVFTAAVVAADTEATPPWLATEYVGGVSLHDAVADAGPLPRTTVWRLGAGLAEALEAIHRAGVVHRDLKPSNVLLAENGPRVIDFGISVTNDASALTTTGVAVGTPAFMAPEQLTGKRPVGPATDVFALGCVLAFAVTGAGPFGDGPTQGVMYRIVHEQPLLERVPVSLRGVVASCLHKDPGDRPEVGELMELLREGAEIGPDRSADVKGWLPGEIADLVTLRAEIPHTPTVLDPGRPAPRPPQHQPQPRRQQQQQQQPRPGRTRDEADESGPARRAVVRAGSTAVAAAALSGVGYGGWKALKWLFGEAESLFPDLTTADSEQRWAFKGGMDDTFRDDSSPAVSGGVVYVGAVDADFRDRLYALDAATGRQRWSHRTHGRTGSPVVSGGTVYVADDNLYLYALDAATGRRTWTVRLEGSMETPAAPRVVDGVLYATASAMGAAGFFGYVYAFDAADGSLRRRFQADSVIRSSPCVSGGVVYVGSYDHNVYALDAATGHRRWTFPTKGQVTTSPAVSDGTVFAGSGDHHLYALDAATGRKRWVFAADAPVNAAPAVSDGIVCVGADSPSLYGVDAATGHRRWKTTFHSKIATSALTAAAGLVYVGVDGCLFAVDAKSGRRRWKSDMGGVNSFSSPAVSGSVAYIGGYGAVYAVSEKR
ncbi:serine/threonine-protein kinase [Streptomyces sp. NBC_00588]|uniref:serine/threonine-protein kinase n=1 Tax=Streptomyces sp. NBC_00588 TaxID=2975784 RepID=UPI002E81E585|nr:serine/threonine-protein kinase [Streptomyces sp. NBC_00588]WUB35060.1 serine/threonine-protein kinase [Streptomyces sp. NBC_00588]